MIRHNRTLDMLEGSTAREIREAITHHIPDEYVLSNDHTTLEFVLPDPAKLGDGWMAYAAEILSDFHQARDGDSNTAYIDAALALADIVEGLLKRVSDQGQS